MSAPSTIYEIMFDDGTVVDSTRSTHVASATNYWVSRNLPSSGYEALDSTIGGNNCEVMQFYFAGHGAGNYVTNFKFFVSDRNAIAQDMTFASYSSNTFSAPSGFSDAALAGLTGDWTAASVALPDATNVLPYTGYTATSDPLVTQFVYFACLVGAGKATGTASWKTRLIYQYT